MKPGDFLKAVSPTTGTNTHAIVTTAKSELAILRLFNSRWVGWAR